eukprot:TRINITY_DN9913_c0_g1_i1.p1 TRINITY_DN9913_c0_g1~~TRINITY_DN9913_c0_g1_i1.p1  ORF type:complete len:184 (-),score=40.73 TRINITY_DN9913_c0_g1_i1:87-638(-)
MISISKLSKSAHFQMSKSLLLVCIGQPHHHGIKPKPHPSPTTNLRSPFSTTLQLLHSEDPSLPLGHIPVHFVLKDGSVVDALGRDGEVALRLAQRYDVPMEGACEASLACTTCHCYVEEDKYFDMLPEANEDEEDLLDKAPFLDMTSRLGCQIILTEEMGGIRLRLPRATANFYVDGHVPQPH